MAGKIQNPGSNVQDASDNEANPASPECARLFLTISTPLRDTLESALKLVTEAAQEHDQRSKRDNMAVKYLVNLLGQPRDEGQHGCSPGFATEHDARTAIRYLKGSVLVELQKSSWPEEERHQRPAVNNTLRDAFKALELTSANKIDLATELSFLMAGSITIQHWSAGMTLPAARVTPPEAVG